MVAVFTDADATVIAAVIALVGILAAQWRQNRRVHRENRDDHAATGRKVDQLVAGQSEFRTDIREMRADVRDIKSDVRSHGDRLRHLELPKEPHS